jgi:hypothetical protein
MIVLVEGMAILESYNGLSASRLVSAHLPRITSPSQVLGKIRLKTRHSMLVKNRLSSSILAVFKRTGTVYMKASKINTIPFLCVATAVLESASLSI